MHLDILSKQQQELLNFVSVFKRNYYLVGGTAIALHIGHRRSIDFDLFTSKKINKSLINNIFAFIADIICHESFCSWAQSKMERLCRFIFYYKRLLFYK